MHTNSIHCIELVFRLSTYFFSLYKIVHTVKKTWNRIDLSSLTTWFLGSSKLFVACLDAQCVSNQRLEPMFLSVCMMCRSLRDRALCMLVCVLCVCLCVRALLVYVCVLCVWALWVFEFVLCGNQCVWALGICVCRALCALSLCALKKRYATIYRITNW